MPLYHPTTSIPLSLQYTGYGIGIFVIAIGVRAYIQPAAHLKGIGILSTTARETAFINCFARIYGVRSETLGTAIVAAV